MITEIKKSATRYLTMIRT